MEAVTVKEAKEKWCCMGINKQYAVCCGADKCLGWRWFDNREFIGERRGYCGLPGKPKA